MSKQGMLGTLSLSDVQGPMDELQSRLAGGEGQIWLQALKRFLRKEDSWPGSSSPRIGVRFFVLSSYAEQFTRDEYLPAVPSLGMSILFDNDEVNPDYVYIVKGVEMCAGRDDYAVVVTLELVSDEIVGDIKNPNSGWEQC